MPQERQHPYSIQISSPHGLHVISVLAENHKEAAKKLSRIAGRNSIQTDTFKKDGKRIPKSRWNDALNG